MTMRMMEFVILGRFVPEHGFPEHKAWSVGVAAYSQMVADLDNFVGVMGFRAWVTI